MDDGLAILHCLDSGKAEAPGITATFGNGSLDTTGASFSLCASLGKSWTSRIFPATGRLRMDMARCRKMLFECGFSYIRESASACWPPPMGAAAGKGFSSLCPGRLKSAAAPQRPAAGRHGGFDSGSGADLPDAGSRDLKTINYLFINNKEKS